MKMKRKNTDIDTSVFIKNDDKLRMRCKQMKCTLSSENEVAAEFDRWI